MKKTFSRLLSSVLAASLLIGSLAACTNDGGKTDAKEAEYNAAVALLEEGKYAEARAAFEALGDYKDAKERFDRFIFFPTEMEYELFDRSGVMTITLGENHLPVHMVSVGNLGTKDGVYVYDSEGRMLSQTVTHGETVYVYNYTYDENSNMTKAEFSTDGAVTQVHNFSYSKEGWLTKELVATGDVVILDVLNIYDENGALTKRTAKQSGTESIYTCTYNSDGKILKEVCEGSDGGSYTIDYTYDEKGALIKELYADSEKTCTTEHTYDSAGNRIKVEDTDSDGTIASITREYDAYGNVTKEVFAYPDGTVETIKSKYVLTYLSIDVPKATMDQLETIFTLR